MVWIADNKGSGPWNFTKQHDKPHYNEGNLISNAGDPVWGDAFLTSHIGAEPITSEHYPWCGYWPKAVGVSTVSLDADIFVLNQSGFPTIYGVNFNGENLTYTGKYQSGGVLNTLILYESNLLTISGGGATAELRYISIEAVGEEFSLLNTYDIFNSYDIRESFKGVLVNGDSNKIYYADSTSVIVSVDNLVRDKRGFRHTVITGTDGNLYVVHATVTSWTEDWHPITGAHWSAFWHLIEDNICDTILGTWGIDPLIHDGSVAIDTTYHNGYLYTVDFSSYSSPIKKIAPTTLETINSYTAIYSLNRITAYDGKIYAIGGATTVTAYIFNASNLSLICSKVLPDGRAANGDLEVVGDYLIVSSASYGGNNATLYKLSLENLAILDSVLSITGTDALGGQQLAVINDTYVAVVWNNGISVYNIDSMAIIDRLFLSHLEFGYHAQAVVVKHN